MRIKHCTGNFSPLGSTVQLNVVVDADNKQKLYETLLKIKQGMPYQLELKPERKKRSLTANAYCWVLLDKLAEKLKNTPEEIYKIAISHVGVFEEIKVNSAEAGKRFKRIWHQNGLGWLTKTIDDTTILAYYGSSTYDTQQMARLIDYIQEECKEQGIEVRPQWEVDAMLTEWDKRG